MDTANHHPSRVRRFWPLLAGLAACLALATGLALVTGCAKYTQQFKDAPRSGIVNDQPVDIIYMPDGFNNLGTKCDHGNRLYVSFHEDGAYGFMSVVPKDPTCATR